MDYSDDDNEICLQKCLTELKRFNLEGYVYEESQSNNSSLVFNRTCPPASSAVGDDEEEEDGGDAKSMKTKKAPATAALATAFLSKNKSTAPNTAKTVINVDDDEEVVEEVSAPAKKSRRK